MNPHAGDTVTSTKSSSSPLTTTKQTTQLTTIKSTTTGECCNSGRITPRFDAKANKTRKRRQQSQESEILPPVNKSRRQTESLAHTGGSRSRLGDFFSTLASKIRGTKSVESAVVISPESSENRKVEFTMESSNDKKHTNESDEHENNDSTKRRRIERRDTFEIEKFDNIGVKESTDLKNDCKNSESNAFSVDSDNEVSQTSKDNQNEIIDVCRNIVADMSEKIQSAEDSLTSISTVVLSTDLNSSPSIEPTEKHEGTVQSIMSAGKRRYAMLRANHKSSSTSLSSQSTVSKKSVTIIEAGKESADENSSVSGRLHKKLFNKAPQDEAARLRKTIQWLEENARRLREDLASVRAELHEERRASKILRRELETAVREARNDEAAKYTEIISGLKARLSQSPTRATVDVQPSQSKIDLLKEENHKREIAALKNRLSEAEIMIQKLKTDSLLDRSRGRRKNKDDGKIGRAEVRKIEVEIQSLRAANKKLEEKLQIAEESSRARASELRQEHEKHEAEMAALQKNLRSDTIKLIDEIQSKSREIEKLEKLVRESAQINEKLRSKEDETMRKLRESEKNRLAPRLEEKIHRDDDEHEVDQCKVECEVEEANVTELDRLRELAIDQKEVIEMLRQAIKEKDRKLDSMIRKQQKESYYKQYINLETVAEVDNESDEFYEEGDSALSSAPSSLSPQPGSGSCRGGCGGPNGVTVEAYRSLLLEVEELQTKLLEEQSELSHAKSQVRDLEKALLQETRGSQTSRLALNEKLREAAEREARLQEKIADLTEINDNLEFRILELEELPNQRDTPDPADSGIVSPEPTHLYKDHQQTSHHEERVVATITPYTYSSPSSETQKSLSLQESGIFEDEDAEYSQIDGSKKPRLSRSSNQSTQTEAPAGELLQEVQRLQELRVRIQERAAKIPPPAPLSPIENRKSELRCDCFAELMQLREKVGKLEEQVKSYEKERLITKQREEELLDENESLVERVFVLEAELKELEEKLSEVKFTKDAEVMTDSVVVPAKRDFTQQFEQAEKERIPVDSKSTSKCEDLYKAAVVHLDDEPKTSCISDPVPKTQYCLRCCDRSQDNDLGYSSMPLRREVRLRKHINSLERSGNAMLKTLLNADEGWAKLQAEYEDKLKDMVDQLNAQREINRSLVKQLIKTRDEEDEQMEVDEADSGLDGSIVTQTTDEMEMERSSLSVSDVSEDSRVSTISRTEIKMVSSDVKDQTSRLLIVEPPTEVGIEAKEGDPSLRTVVTVEATPVVKQDNSQVSIVQQLEPDAHVSTVSTSSGEKKQIIYFRWR